jgi:hypothetical protein
MGGAIMEESFPSRKKSTWRKILLWIGLEIFITSVIFVFTYRLYLSPSKGIPRCSFTHTTSFVNSMTDQESKILTVSFYGENEDCTTHVQLDITNFDISPSENVQDVSILVHQKTQIKWVLYPKSQGKFSYVVSFPDPDSQALSTDESTVTVTNAVGLPAWVTSNFGPLALLVFGPMLTVPYWIDKCSTWIKKRKGKQKSQAGKTRRRTKKR